MKYTKEERLDIGRRIYEGELSRYQAADVYGISDETARNYMRLYRDASHCRQHSAAQTYALIRLLCVARPSDLVLKLKD